MTPNETDPDDETMSRAELLAMQGSGFELTNDELEGLSDTEPARD